MSPFYAAHGVELLLPFDIMETMFLVSKITTHLPTASLLAICAWMLQKCEDNLARIHNHVLATRYTSAWDFEKQNINRIQDYSFDSKELVLVLNEKIEPEIGWKCRPCYFGPMVVINWSQGGGYTLAEIDGTVSCLKYMAFCLIPYYVYFQNCLEITEFVNINNLSDGEEIEVEDMMRTLFPERKVEVTFRLPTECDSYGSFLFFYFYFISFILFLILLFPLLLTNNYLCN